MDLAVPSLQEIAMDMLNLLHPGLQSYDTEQLAQLNLPTFIHEKFFPGRSDRLVDRYFVDDSDEQATDEDMQQAG